MLYFLLLSAVRPFHILNGHIVPANYRINFVITERSNFTWLSKVNIFYMSSYVCLPFLNRDFLNLEETDRDRDFVNKTQ